MELFLICAVHNLTPRALWTVVATQCFRQALSKAWRFGQQMRQYFDYGDVRDAVNSHIELQRQQVRPLLGCSPVDPG